MTSPIEEPQDLGLEPPDDTPPGKLDYFAAVYGWMKHVHLEVEGLREMMISAGREEVVARIDHIDASFDEAMRELALYVPEGKREAALARASSRRDAMAKHPLPPFPKAEPPFGTEERSDQGYMP